MLYRVRATVKDRPGVLAALATSCGRAGINILSLQVFPAHDGVTDELVVSVGGRWSEVDVRDLVLEAGGDHVSVTRCTARSLTDGPTRYLQAAARVIEGATPLDAELVDLLETDPPDVADYAGHDTLEIEGASVARAVPFTPVERARADALGALVRIVVAQEAPVGAIAAARASDTDVALVRPAAERVTAPAPVALPSEVRAATPDDAPAIAAMHTRCSQGTLYRRYQAPLQGAIHPRMARRLASPVGGRAVVATAGDAVVGHAMVVRTDDETPTTWELGLIVEDAYQRRGVGTTLLRRAARLAREHGASDAVIVTEPGNDAVLRTVGRAGFLAHLTRADNTVRISVDVSLS